MKTTMNYREYQASDAPYLENIIRRTWNYDRFSSAAAAKRMAHLYLLSCLSQQSFTQVAVKGEEPVGIIMARDKQQKAAGHFGMKRNCAIFTMLCHREDRAILKTFGGISSIDEDLLKSRKKEYDGEIVFFALNESCRGMGVGKTLFEKAQNYFKDQHIKDFYLYTDSSCNYGFYEHQGMKRCGEKSATIPVGIDNTMHFYLYEYQFV